jgi:hypothetical protein
VSFSYRIRQCFCSIPRFNLCHVLSSSTNNFAHAQTLSWMSSLSGRLNIARVNIGFFTGFKKIKQRRISFVLGYLRMILWKISTAINIKHRILATFNIKKNQFWQPCMPLRNIFNFWTGYTIYSGFGQLTLMKSVNCSKPVYTSSLYKYNLFKNFNFPFNLIFTT